MKILENFDLAQVLWYKLGGTCKYLLECDSKEDITEAIEFVYKNSIKNVFVLGFGSNLIFAKDSYDGAVIHILPPEKSSIKLLDNNMVESFVGENLDDLIQFGFSNALIGLEWAGGLPGTVGAAVRGNVGAFGGEIKDVVVSAEILDVEKRKVHTLLNKDLEFKYRSSKVKIEQGLIVLSVKFNLIPTEDEGLRRAKEIYQANIQYRKDRHPLEYPNCGSVFKNVHEKDDVEKVLRVFPEVKEFVEGKWHGKVAMGYVIEKLGLAGYTVGDAQVSKKHKNFIINLGNAKASDVLQIIEKVKTDTNDRFGFTPEVEVEIV